MNLKKPVKAQIEFNVRRENCFHDAHFEAFDEICQFKPRCEYYSYLRTDATDPRFPKLLALADSLGMQRWDLGPGDKQGKYECNLRIITDLDDPTGARLFYPHPAHVFNDFYVNACPMRMDKELVLDTKVMSGQNREGHVPSATVKKLYAGELHMAKLTYGKITVSEHLKQMLLAEGFKGVKLDLEIPFIGKHAAKVPQKYWLLESHAVLPHAVPRPEEYERPITGDVKLDRRLRQYRHILDSSAYTETMLREFGDFDVAVPTEVIWPIKNHALVVSRRFKDFCDAQHLEQKWEAVEVLPI